MSRYPAKCAGLPDLGAATPRRCILFMQSVESMRADALRSGLFQPGYVRHLTTLSLGAQAALIHSESVRAERKRAPKQPKTPIVSNQLVLL